MFASSFSDNLTLGFSVTSAQITLAGGKCQPVAQKINSINNTFDMNITNISIQFRCKSIQSKWDPVFFSNSPNGTTKFMKVKQQNKNTMVKGIIKNKRVDMELIWRSEKNENWLPELENIKKYIFI